MISSQIFHMENIELTHSRKFGTIKITRAVRFNEVTNLLPGTRAHRPFSKLSSRFVVCEIVISFQKLRPKIPNANFYISSEIARGIFFEYFFLISQISTDILCELYSRSNFKFSLFSSSLKYDIKLSIFLLFLSFFRHDDFKVSINRVIMKIPVFRETKCN